MNAPIISRSLEDSTVITVELSAACDVRFKCATQDAADALMSSLQGKSVVVTGVSVEFPREDF